MNYAAGRLQNRISGNFVRSGGRRSGIPITVTDHETDEAATIYTTETLDTVDSSVVTGERGYFEFYVTAGIYDVTINGQTETWDARTAPVSVTGEAGTASTLAELTDVDLTGAAEGDVLTVQGDGTVAAQSGTSGAVAVDNEGVEVLAVAERLDFVGAGVTASDGGGGTAIITVPSGGSGMSEIETATLGADVGSVTLSSIPQTFRHLRLVIVTRSAEVATTAIVRMRFNADSGANYNWRRAFNNGSLVSGEAMAATSGVVGVVAAASADAGQAGVIIIDIPGYSGSTWQKSYVATSYSGANDNFTQDASGLWKSTAGITSITLIPDALNLKAGSTFTLLGVGAV